MMIQRNLIKSEVVQHSQDLNSSQRLELLDPSTKISVDDVGEVGYNNDGTKDKDDNDDGDGDSDDDDDDGDRPTSFHGGEKFVLKASVDKNRRKKLMRTICISLAEVAATTTSAIARAPT